MEKLLSHRSLMPTVFSANDDLEANLNNPKEISPANLRKNSEKSKKDIKQNKLCCGLEMTNKIRKNHSKMDQIDSGTYERRSVNVPIDAGVGEHGELLGNLHDVTFRSRGNFDINMYATKKTAANGLLDLALLMANASQLKHMILTEGEHVFFYPMMALLILSILLQIIIGLGLLFLARVNISESQEYDIEKIRRNADRMNNWIVAAIFLLTVVNVFISAFGLNEKREPLTRRRD